MSGTATKTTTVRVTPETHDTLKAMAEQRGTSMQDLIQKLAEDAKAAAFLEEMNAGFAALKSDESAWAEEQAELAEWDRVLGDNLE